MTTYDYSIYDQIKCCRIVNNLFTFVLDVFSRFLKPTPCGGCQYWHGTLNKALFFCLQSDLPVLLTTLQVYAVCWVLLSAIKTFSFVKGNVSIWEEYKGYVSRSAKLIKRITGLNKSFLIGCS
jgi:hypothetical protein